MEVTYRTVQGRYLLRPSREVNETLIGILARACERYPKVSLIGVVALSNHVHLLLSVESQHDLSRVMEYFGGQVARKVGRLQGWSGPFWHRRYRGICVTEETEAQIERLEYLLAQSLKENLVEKVSDWPGVHFAKALLEGRKLLVGTWVDETKRYQDSLRQDSYDAEDYVLSETVEMQPLPCWTHLSWREYVERVRRIVRRLEEEAAAARRLAGGRVLGAAAILFKNPHSLPEKVERTPAPSVHAASKVARRAFRKALSWFLEEYREAAERLKAGDPAPRFPDGCFPPRLPFVGSAGGVPLQSAAL